MKNEVKKKMHVRQRVMLYQSHTEMRVKTRISASTSPKHGSSTPSRTICIHRHCLDASQIFVSGGADSGWNSRRNRLEKFIVSASCCIYNEVANLRGSMINGGFR
jgi:hypothetical protein